MKPLKELEYYMHKGEKVYYAKAEDIKSAVGLARLEIIEMIDLCANASLHGELEARLIHKAKQESYEHALNILYKAFPALYGNEDLENLQAKNECEHNNPLGMCHACSVEREICECKEGVE